MRPIWTRLTTGVYGAPKGEEDRVNGLPYYREDNEFGGKTVLSVWTFTEDERKVIAAGGNLVLGIYSEPIPPVHMNVMSEDEAFFTEIDNGERIES